MRRLWTKLSAGCSRPEPDRLAQKESRELWNAYYSEGVRKFQPRVCFETLGLAACLLGWSQL